MAVKKKRKRRSTKVKASVVSLALVTPTGLTCVANLVHYAIDKVSSYSLALHPETATYEKIKNLTLSKLAVTDVGKGMMWSWINTYSAQCGAKPVSAGDGSKARTVQNVYELVVKTMK